MAFIHRYEKIDSKNYFHTQEFSEDQTTFILAAGTTQYLGLITRVENDGSVGWEKSYRISEENEQVIIKDIIQMKPVVPQDPGFQYIAYATSRLKHYLISIDSSDGTVNWIKELRGVSSDPNINLTGGMEEYCFYLTVSDLTDRFFLGRFDGTGAMVSGKDVQLASSGVAINALTPRKKGVIVAGCRNPSQKVGILLDFEDVLTVAHYVDFNTPSGNEIHDVEFDGKDYFLSGYLETQKTVFATRYNGASNPTATYFPDTLNEKSRIQLAGSEMYVLHYTSTNGILHLIDSNFASIWAKQIIFEDGENGISKIHFCPESGYLTTDAYNADVKSQVVYTTGSFESCRTAQLQRPKLDRIQMTRGGQSVLISDSPLTFQTPVIQEAIANPSIIAVCPLTTGIPIDETTSFQSPNFYLQSAGSNGVDSTLGVHSRWLFRGALGDKHLPKGNYAGNTHNFNKPDDWVRVYRTRYRAFTFELDLFAAPTVVDSTNKFWIYRFGQRDIYVYFRNTAAYNLAAGSYNPFTNANGFYQAYGNNLIEVENKDDLFFAVQLVPHTSPVGSYVRTETLTVPESTAFAPRYVSNRKQFQGTALQNARLVAENGRILRYRPNNCRVRRLYFEYYSDFIAGVNLELDWTLMGNFGLNLTDADVLQQLEPSPGSVNGSWLRFNDNAFVNTANYINRWNGTVPSGDRNIKQVIEEFISLSDAIGNPTGLESIPVSADPPLNMEISNLDILNLAAFDFHIARMLGLGLTDTAASMNGVSYVYVAEYVTFGDLEDGLGERDVQHLAMGLPTSLTDNRLPKPVEIEEILPGAYSGTEGEMSSLTDEDGYTPDGLFRFVSVFPVEPPAPVANPDFYASSDEIAEHLHTLPVYAGLEYRKNQESVWQKPELANTDQYQNVVPQGQSPHNETRPIIIPEAGLPLYVHMQTVSGTHYYQTYGINWFSRAQSSIVTETIETDLSPANPLIAPTNVNPFLIRNEVPPLLTSPSEQDRYSAISGSDKTLVRLTFDYHSYHELISHRVPLGSTVTNNEILSPANANDPNILFPDNEEILADKIEIFFRDEVPSNIQGMVVAIDDHPSDNLLSVITTGTYELASQSPPEPDPPAQLVPELQPGTGPNYEGGTFILENQQFAIHSVTGTTHPTIIVYKREVTDSIFSSQIPSTNADNLIVPEVTGDGLFMAVENMQNELSWSTPNPLSFKVDVGVNWPIHREIIYSENDEGDQQRHVEKTRGIWSSGPNHSTVETVLEPEALLDGNGNIQLDGNGNIITQDTHQGLYKITFHGIQLSQHSQYHSNTNSVEWYQGIVRIFTQGAFQGGLPFQSRKTLKVEGLENIGASLDLIVYARDNGFSTNIGYDPVQIGPNVSVNYYPGYRVYLYKNDSNGFNAESILPDDEDVKYTVFGLRSFDADESNYSMIGVPAVMYAQNIIEAEQPEQPEGPLYATRPDFYGRATYTFTTQYSHSPYGVLFYRGNDEAFLNALYEKGTILQIRESLKALGGMNEEYFTNRWTNFVNFTELETDGDYKIYPPIGVSPNGYKFPNPDKQSLFDWANQVLAELGLPEITDDPGTLAVGDPKIFNFVKGALFHAMNPLTEVPIIYNRISSNPSYVPKNKKQVIKDANGYALSPNSPLFDMAPMAKRLSSPSRTQYTDFTLDGTSVNIYYYAVREMSSQMKMGEFSVFLGPVKLVNSYPAEPPEIKRIIPVLENPLLGTSPSIQLEINSYPEVQKIKKVSIFRSTSRIDAQSVRTMAHLADHTLAESVLNSPVWQVNDNFDDLQEIPFGDPLYYRVVVNREVEYRDKDNNLVNEFAPSQPSKISASVMVETTRPPAPVLRYGSKPIVHPRGILAAVKLFWDKTCYNGTYRVYKMNSQGNWNEIYSIQTNEQTTYVDLLNTEYASGVLETQDEDGNNIFHHFKVVAQNTAGLLSQEENILTIYRADEWIDVDTLPL